MTEACVDAKDFSSKDSLAARNPAGESSVQPRLDAAIDVKTEAKPDKERVDAPLEQKATASASAALNGLEGIANGSQGASTPEGAATGAGLADNQLQGQEFCEGRPAETEQEEKVIKTDGDPGSCQLTGQESGPGMSSGVAGREMGDQPAPTADEIVQNGDHTSSLKVEAGDSLSFVQLLTKGENEQQPSDKIQGGPTAGVADMGQASETVTALPNTGNTLAASEPRTVTPPEASGDQTNSATTSALLGMTQQQPVNVLARAYENLVNSGTSLMPNFGAFPGSTQVVP